jgi:hypothetical protein
LRRSPAVYLSECTLAGRDSAATAPSAIRHWWLRFAFAT